MVKDFTKRVFGLKFSVFSDAGLRPLDEVDFEMIRIPGFGRYRKPMEGIGSQKFQIVRFSNYQIGRAAMDNGPRIIDSGQRFAGRADIFAPGDGGDLGGSGGYRQLTAVGKELRVERAGVESREFSVRRVGANFLFGGASVLDN
jgi:hypothetical protein